MLFVRHGPRDRTNHSRVPERLDGEIMTHVYPHTDVLHEYVASYGVPRRIVSSPYQRTRGTAKLLQEFLEVQYGILLPVEIEPLIGEYLGGVRDIVDSDFNVSTLLLEPIRDKNRGSFVQRARDYPSKDGVWYVSHSYWISTHLERYGVDIPSTHIPEFRPIIVNLSV